MRRLLILLLWLTVIAAVGLMATALQMTTGLSSLSEIASLLGVAAVLGAVILAVLSDQDLIGNTIIRGPFKRSERRLRRKGALLERSRCRTILRSILEATSTESELPGNVLAEAVADLEPSPSKRVSPSELRVYRNWLHGAIQSSKDSALNRLLVPARSASVTSVAEGVVESLDQFLYHEEVPVAELTRVPVIRSAGDPDDTIRFPDFVTAFTGALVLADASQTRSGFPAGIRVWHDRSYEPSEDGARHYSDRHVHDPSRDSQDEKCQWGAMMRNENRSRADDYDGRVLDLTGVKLVRDKRNGFVELLLLTRESCYAATEVSPRACKGLVVDDDDVRTPRWDISPTIMNINKVESGDAQAKPMVTLVTAFGALILDEADEEGIKHSLVLCRRASGLRNGSDVLSITGGGVINLSIEGMPGDEDSQGFPDPTAAVLRELQEELGIRLERSDAVPISVHVINQRGPSTSVGKSGKGELVATAAFVVHLPMTLAQLREQRVHASSHSGLYESAGLVQIHLPSLIGQKGDSDEERKNNAACAFAIALKANAGELDQQAIIAALYASAAHYSIAATVKAFATVWRRPWYEFAWSNELEKTKVDHDRLARPLDLQLDLISRARVSEVDHFIRNT